MPCVFTQCEPAHEVSRFAGALLGLYVYHFVWDTAVIRPIVGQLVARGYLAKEKKDKMRESLWKNAAVGTFFAMGVYVGWDKDWWMNPHEYFTDFPFVSPEPLRWYYMIYLSFWFQSIDFMLSLTNNHYTVKRKDNAEMLLHHFATISLMVFSYFFDLTKIGMSVLMIHDVNDLLLETAKVFVYLEWETTANILFGTFALAWFVVRWGYYSYNILWSVHTLGWNTLLVPILEAGSFHGFSAQTWYWIYMVFLGFLSLLLVLHVYWGVLIVKMVVKALGDGNVEKDIRSESEGEADDDDEIIPTKDASSKADSHSAKPKRRRAPKAE